MQAQKGRVGIKPTTREAIVLSTEPQHHQINEAPVYTNSLQYIWQKCIVGAIILGCPLPALTH